MKRQLRRARRPLVRAYRQSVVWRMLNPRPVQAIGLGTAKSGTHSLAALLSDHLACSHETDALAVLPHILDFMHDRSTSDDLIAFLKEHDRRWHLALNVAHYFGDVAPVLVQAFPEARFIITIRDCYTWVNSQMAQLLRMRSVTGRHRIWWDLHHARFGDPSDATFEAEEHPLKERGLPPLHAFFAHWAAHNARILDAIPESRRLVVRTSELSHAAHRIVQFLGVPSVPAQGTVPHLFRKPRTQRFDLYDLVDPDYVEHIARPYCAPLMQRYYAEVADVADVTRRTR